MGGKRGAISSYSQILADQLSGGQIISTPSQISDLPTALKTCLSSRFCKDDLSFEQSSTFIWDLSYTYSEL